MDCHAFERSPSDANFSNPCAPPSVSGLPSYKAKGVKHYCFDDMCVPAVAIEVIQCRQSDQSYCRRAKHKLKITLES